MDFALVVRRRLKELRLEQRDLAVASQVTESYVSQLLAKKKTPPAPHRTDIYDRIGTFLKLPAGELARLAELQRKDELRKRIADPAAPLFKDFRELILRKCARPKRVHVRRIFEKEPFGEIERLVTQKLLDVAKGVAKDELDSQDWLRLVARLSGRSYRRIRVMVLEFLDTDVFHVSLENCVCFLDPIIDSWDIDLETFAVEVVLNGRLALDRLKRFEFTESAAEEPPGIEPGLREFLADPALGGQAAEDEILFLKSLRFKGRRPTALYYYRELQNLRDPLHFRPERPPTAPPPQPQRSPERKRRAAKASKQRQRPSGQPLPVPSSL